jgi:kynureninase
MRKGALGLQITNHPSPITDLLDLRAHYHLPPPPAVDLRAFTHGAMPRTVPDMLRRFAEDWAERGVDAWNEVPDHWTAGAARVGWWTLPEHLGDAFIAPLLGAPHGTCVMQPNVHHTVSFLLSCPEPFADGRREVVFTGAEFPSVQHAARRWSALTGVEPRSVPPGADGFLDVDAVLDAVTDRTAWVFVSHVGFTTGEVVADDALRAIADRARRHGAHFGIDGYHATASVPVDVAALGCDVYFGGLLKEGSGSSGNAYLYVAPACALAPALAGWFADAVPFEFAPAPVDHPIVRRRFLGGTTAVAPLYHAVEGLRVLLGAGIDAVRADTLEKTAHAIARADAAGLQVRSPRDARRGAMVILEIEGADRLCEWLKTRAVYTDSRQGRFLRMAPFVYNTAGEIDAAFEAIAEGVAAGAHRTFDVPAAGGPVT